MAINISQIEIKASTQKVWNALTDPQMVKKWQYGSELLTNWNIGSEIRFKTEWKGTVFEQWGIVKELRPCHRLKYTLFAPRPNLEDKPENHFVMEYILTEKGKNTWLQIIQTDNRPGSKQEEPQGEENNVLKNLKQLVETSA